MAVPQNLNIGNGKVEATVDQINTWMRSTPWYQAKMQAWGQDPGHPHLSKDQAKELLHLAQANGIQVDESDAEVDRGGNFDKKGHALRNTLIAAGIAGATIATMGAAGVFAGAAGAGGAGAAGGGAAGTLAGTTTLGSSVLGGSGLTSAGIAGGTGLGAGGTGALLAGGAIPAGSALAGSAGGGGSIASTLLGAGEKYAAKKGVTTAADLLRGGGQGVGNIANAAEENRLTADESRRKGQNDYENQLLNRSQLEAQQRQQALKDLYRQSYTANRKPGPYNTAGLTPYSADYTAGLSAIGQQGLTRLQKPAAYGMDTAPALVPFKPTPQGKVEKIGTYASPALTLGGMALDYYRNR